MFIIDVAIIETVGYDEFEYSPYINWDPNSVSDVFVLPPCDSKSIAFTILISMASYPVRPSLEIASRYVQMASIALNTNSNITVDILYPMLRPVLYMHIANEMKPIQCVSKHRLAIHTEHLTIQFQYTRHTRLVSLLIYVGNVLSSKCTYRTKPTNIFELSTDYNMLKIHHDSATSKIGFLSSIEYFPRILTYLEILKQFEKPFFLRSAFDGNCYIHIK